MANAKGKEMDGTHLSVEQAETRGFLHRDYIAHCLRWTKIAKDLGISGRFKETDLIDVGCGKDMPLARTLMTGRMAPRRYLGVEWNKMELPDMFANTKFKPELVTQTDFTTMDIPADSFNTSVCLEVLEHVEPEKAIGILDKIAEEAEETINAAKFEGDEALIHEVADLWFHCLVLLSKKNLTVGDITKELKNNFVDIDKISSLTGKDIIIHLKDGRKLEGVIIKIMYEIDLIGKKYEVIKFLNSNKKMSIKTSLIESIETSK
jgi:phosphoribosyl-ATP pyrophosphohydrolase